MEYKQRHKQCFEKRFRACLFGILYEMEDIGSQYFEMHNMTITITLPNYPLGTKDAIT